MPERFTLDPILDIGELDAYHRDILASLRLYFRPSAPDFAVRFAGKRPDEVNRKLAERLNESDVRSVLFVLTSLEASFRVDFDVRCRKRLKDVLSVHFREVERARQNAVRLDEDILEGWKRHSDAPPALISDLRGAFKFRHWLAHGRYWNPKLGRRYDFDYVHLIAKAIVFGFPFAA
jgi:hypothetical protein